MPNEESIKKAQYVTYDFGYTQAERDKKFLLI